MEYKFEQGDKVIRDGATFEIQSINETDGTASVLKWDAYGDSFGVYNPMPFGKNSFKLSDLKPFYKKMPAPTNLETAESLNIKFDEEGFLRITIGYDGKQIATHLNSIQAKQLQKLIELKS